MAIVLRKLHGMVRRASNLCASWVCFVLSGPHVPVLPDALAGSSRTGMNNVG